MNSVTQIVFARKKKTLKLKSVFTQIHGGKTVD